ncbi:MAG: hypothetical protein LC792_18350, partial [Actinobacteria bacterium]|nr:hypothetical protein [Actinomycetota bacterium]
MRRFHRVGSASGRRGLRPGRAAFAESADQHVYRLLAAPLAEAVARAADPAAGAVLDVAAGSGA